MSAQPALRLVDHVTGEIVERPECEHCAYLQDQLAGAERELRAWRRRYADLARDKDAEAREHEMWPRAIRIFEAWKRECKHPRAAWTADRFFLLLPLLKRYGDAVCLRAVAGIAYDCFRRPRRNGTIQRFDEFERCFKDAGHLERYANAAPRGWAP